MPHQVILNYIVALNFKGSCWKIAESVAKFMKYSYFYHDQSMPSISETVADQKA